MIFIACGLMAAISNASLPNQEKIHPLSGHPPYTACGIPGGCWGSMEQGLHSRSCPSTKSLFGGGDELFFMTGSCHTAIKNKQLEKVPHRIA
jgi:hypothetical protein